MPLSRRIYPFLGSTLILGFLVTLAGCGSAPGKVSGKVTYKGAPLKGGNVTFVGPPGSVAASGPIKEDGTYSLDKAPTGTVKITVETSSLKPARGSKAPPTYSAPPGAANPGGYTPPTPVDRPKLYVLIPEKYENAETSPLTTTLKGGSNTYNIELE